MLRSAEKKKRLGHDLRIESSEFHFEFLIWIRWTTWNGLCYDRTNSQTQNDKIFYAKSALFSSYVYHHIPQEFKKYFFDWKVRKFLIAILGYDRQIPREGSCLEEFLIN